MVLSAFQGRRVASRALELILGIARSEEQFDRIHAFPSVTNQPSNALCRRFGFELMEETDFLYRGAQLRVKRLGAGARVMGDPGLEPGTSSLSEKRSNRLS